MTHCGAPDLDFSSVHTTSLQDRPSKVTLKDFAQPWDLGGSFNDFMGRLPQVLAASHLKEVVSAIAKARRQHRMVILAMGAHPVKVGLNPIIIDLMRRGLITALAFNGAVVVHDTEVALAGKTSETVEAGIDSGDFGVTQETGSMVNRAIKSGAGQGLGLGAAVGQRLLDSDCPYSEFSLLAQSVKLGRPAT
ncbi:MAG: hypothetical protein HQK56_04600, partial [Deltaproteobacteria bacterium]|nr:hypothetical protein [Deltaproteobacteria bacterium]